MKFKMPEPILSLQFAAEAQHIDQVKKCKKALRGENEKQGINTQVDTIVTMQQSSVVISSAAKHGSHGKHAIGWRVVTCAIKWFSPLPRRSYSVDPNALYYLRPEMSRFCALMYLVVS
jgi:hypothetical protein